MSRRKRSRLSSCTSGMFLWKYYNLMMYHYLLNDLWILLKVSYELKLFIWYISMLVVQIWYYQSQKLSGKLALFCSTFIVLLPVQFTSWHLGFVLLLMNKNGHLASNIKLCDAHVGKQLICMDAIINRAEIL